MTQSLRHMTSPAHVAALEGNSFGRTICNLSFVTILRVKERGGRGERRNPLLLSESDCYFDNIAKINTKIQIKTLWQQFYEFLFRFRQF